MTRSSKWEGLYASLNKVIDAMEQHLAKTKEVSILGKLSKEGLTNIRDILLIQEETHAKDMEAKELHQEDMARKLAAMSSEMEGKDALIKQLQSQVQDLTSTSEELKKALPEDGELPRIEEIARDMEAKIEATKQVINNEWKEVVKKGIKKEAEEWKATTSKSKGIQEVEIVNATIQEERLRHARRLNVRVTGIEEKEGTTPQEDGQELCRKLGYKEDELPFLKAWRAGKDLTRPRALILQFEDEVKRVVFFKKRVILRGLEGSPIYLDEDLTHAQVEHRKQLMPKVRAARAQGKKAVYRDGHVIIDGKVIA